MPLTSDVTPTLPVPPDYDEPQRLQHEIDALGFPLSRHPLDLHPYARSLSGIVPARTLTQHVGETVLLLGWLITRKEAWTKEGEPMEFLSFEDTTALYDATVFPAVYRRVCHRLRTDRGYAIKGSWKRNSAR